MRANQACSSGLFAASAKNGSPIDTVNSPSSQNASPTAGGLPQPLAIESGKKKHATAITAIWMNRDLRPGA